MPRYGSQPDLDRRHPGRVHGHQHTHIGNPRSRAARQPPAALAHRLDELVRAGVIADYATLAELAHVSRARMSQILTLIVLAPDNPET